MDGLLILDQAENIATIFAMLGTTEIPKVKLCSLTSRLNRLNSVGNPRARDILFELEVAGRIARHPELKVSFEEPDIVIDMPVGFLALACKRLTSVKQIDKRIRKAADQGSRSSHPFFIILEVEHLITRGKFVFAPSEDELERQCNRELDNLLMNCSSAALSAFDKGCGGIILCRRLVGIVGSLPGNAHAIRWYVRHKYIPNIEFPDAAATLGTLVELMEMQRDLP